MGILSQMRNWLDDGDDEPEHTLLDLEDLDDMEIVENVPEDDEEPSDVVIIAWLRAVSRLEQRGITFLYNADCEVEWYRSSR